MANGRQPPSGPPRPPSGRPPRGPLGQPPQRQVGIETSQKDYDVAPNFGTLVDKHRQLPFKRFMDLIGSKLDDLNDRLLKPTPFDQGPGRIIPYAIPAWFGPLSLTTSRRGTVASNPSPNNGHELLATLATPDKFSIPRNGDIIIDREMSFHCNSLSAYGFVNWGYTATPGFDVPFTNKAGVGDILDAVGPNPAIGPNGGAMPLDYFGGTFSTISTPQPNLPNIAFEVELYDKLRGRRMHDAKLPVEMFQGGRIAHRKTASVLKFETGGRIEPRLFVNEIRMGSILDTATAFNAASVKVWVCLVFKGTQHVEIPNL